MTDDDLNPEDLDGFILSDVNPHPSDILDLAPPAVVFGEWAERERFDPETGTYEHESDSGPDHAHGRVKPSQDFSPTTPVLKFRPQREFLPENVLFDSYEELEAIDINSDWWPTGKDEGLFVLCHECGNQVVEDEDTARCCVCAFQVKRRRLLAGSALDDAT